MAPIASPSDIQKCYFQFSTYLLGTFWVAESNTILLLPIHKLLLVLAFSIQFCLIFGQCLLQIMEHLKDLDGNSLSGSIDRAEDGRSSS